MSLPETCPVCGAPTLSGYGLMGGGMGPYVFCSNETCDWMLKEQDSDLPEKDDAAPPHDPR